MIDPEDPGTQDLFPDVEGEEETYKPNVIATAKKLTKVDGEVYDLSVPSIFPSKHEEMYLAQNIINSLELQGFTPVEHYVIFKQLESLAKKGQEQSKQAATDYVIEYGIKHTRGVKISMRSSFGGYEYPADVEADRQKLIKEIDDLKNSLKTLEDTAKLRGIAKKIPGKKGISVSFREM